MIRGLGSECLLLGVTAIGRCAIERCAIGTDYFERSAVMECLLLLEISVYFRILLKEGQVP